LKLRADIPLLLIGLLSAVVGVNAQNKDKDKKADTVKIKPSYIPTGVRVGTDLISLVRSPIDDTFNGYEFNADVDFYRYYFVVDYGHWERKWVHEGDTPDQSDVYSNTGNYWRVGADVNFLKNDPDRNMFFLGLRYARSKFSETMIYNSVDDIWGSHQAVVTNQNLPAGWIELTTGLRVKIWKIFWLGYTARLKFGLKTGSTTDMAPSDVPGYGRADKDSYWGFNYQLFIRIPTRKAPPLPLKK
jgi:hypothetical protein